VFVWVVGLTFLWFLRTPLWGGGLGGGIVGGKKNTMQWEAGEEGYALCLSGGAQKNGAKKKKGGKVSQKNVRQKDGILTKPPQTGALFEQGLGGKRNELN